MDDNSGDDAGKVYDFKDSKTSGVVTVTKSWDDSLSNDERPVPDVSISTAKPSKNPLGYTITYHGNGLTFEDGTTENEVVVNKSGKIISGQYKELLASSGWYSDSNCTTKIETGSNGLPVSCVTSDIDLYAKSKTFVLKTGSNFNNLIPLTVTSIIFTDEAMPASATLIDVDEDGDSGVVAWMDETTMKVSTQVKGLKVQANPNSRCIFYIRDHLKNIDLSMLDTRNVNNMAYMFSSCPELTALDISSLDTHNVTNMGSMFSGCESLASLDLSSLDTSNVTAMYQMFCNCSGLTTLDLSHLDTQKVTDMRYMFSGCSGLTNLDLTPLDTSKVTDMSYMFDGCPALTTLSIGVKFAFIGSNYQLPSGTWYASDGTAYTSDGTTCTIPGNKADTYTRR